MEPAGSEREVRPALAVQVLYFGVGPCAEFGSIGRRPAARRGQRADELADTSSAIKTSASAPRPELSSRPVVGLDDGGSDALSGGCVGVALTSQFIYESPCPHARRSRMKARPQGALSSPVVAPRV